MAALVGDKNLKSVMKNKRVFKDKVHTQLSKVMS